MDRDSSLVPPYLKEHGVTFLNLLDPRGEVFPMFGVRYTPTNYFVDRRGVLVGGTIGYRKWDSPEAILFIEELLVQPNKLSRR